MTNSPSDDGFDLEEHRPRLTPEEVREIVELAREDETVVLNDWSILGISSPNLVTELLKSHKLRLKIFPSAS